MISAKDIKSIFENETDMFQEWNARGLLGNDKIKFTVFEEQLQIDMC